MMGLKSKVICNNILYFIVRIFKYNRVLKYNTNILYIYIYKNMIYIFTCVVHKKYFYFSQAHRIVLDHIGHVFAMNS